MSDRHDATVDRLVGLLRDHFRADPEVTVCDRVHWQPMEEFPEFVPLFDVLIVKGPVVSSSEGGKTVLAEETHPVTIIDVLTGDTFHEDFYEKPDALGLSSVYEYVMFDPTAELMRPNFQAYRKSDDGFRLVGTSVDGVFFSTNQFRLSADAAGSIDLGASGSPLDEETVFNGKRHLANLTAAGAIAERAIIAAREAIAAAEKRLAKRRPRRR